MSLILALPWITIVVLTVLAIRKRARRQWRGSRLVQPKRRKRSGAKFWNDPHA